MGDHTESFEITSDADALCDARARVREWTRRIAWSECDVADVVLALDEALSNVIRHGYKGQCGQPIEVTLSNCKEADRADAGIEIRIRDHAQQVPLDRIAGRDLDDVRPGGLGVHIIKSLMDHAEYRHADGGGMELVMRRFPRGPMDARKSECNE